MCASFYGLDVVAVEGCVKISSAHATELENKTDLIYIDSMTNSMQYEQEHTTTITQ